MTEKSFESELGKGVDAFIEYLMGIDSVDDRLKKMLAYMQHQLSHGEIKPLNRFWKMRQFCLEQFKENLSFSVRSHLWESYQQLVKEIVHLKEILDEKTLFHKEEISKALISLEKNIQQMDQIVASSPLIDIPKVATCLEKNADFYQENQRQLNIINNYAKQLNALKAEILNLEIPYKEKQSLLDHLHQLSDIVFPKKRELLGFISKKYADDIHYFTKVNFEKKELKLPLFDLKDQIKALQAFAKILSLNVGTFSQSREKLSQCWDQIRNFEKAQKKLKEQLKLVYTENETSLVDRIQALKENKESLSKADFDKEVNQIGESIKKTELQKSQRKKLKELLALIDENSSLKDESSEEEDAFIQIQREILNIQEKAKCWDYFTLVKEFKRVQNLYDQSKILDAHQNKILRRLFSIKGLLSEKLLEEVENSADVEELSEQIEDFKSNMKEDMEKYRRALNTSNQSIEKAMLYNELLTQTKLKLSQFDKKIKPSISA